MQGRKIAIVAMALAAVSGNAMAESWVDVTRTPEGALVSVDKDTAEVAAGHVTFWDRTVYSAPRLIGIYGGKLMKADSINGYAHYVEIRGHRDIDCRQKKFGTSAVNYYDAKGALVSNGLQDAAPVAIATASLPAQEAKLMCPAS